MLPADRTSGKWIASRDPGDSQCCTDDDQDCYSAAECDGNTVFLEQDSRHCTHEGRESYGGRRLVKVHES